MAPFLIATLLVAATVIVHAVGFSLILRSLMKSRFGLPTTAWPIARLLMSVTWLLIMIHVAEITLWARRSSSAGGGGVQDGGFHGVSGSGSLARRVPGLHNSIELNPSKI